MLRDKPIIKALDLSTEKIAEINHIIATELKTKKNDKIRKALDGCNLCCVCQQVPSYLISYDMSGGIKRESYCDRCFENTYQRNKDVDINQIIEAYGCTKAPPNTFGRGKKDYES